MDYSRENRKSAIDAQKSFLTLLKLSEEGAEKFENITKIIEDVVEKFAAGEKSLTEVKKPPVVLEELVASLNRTRDAGEKVLLICGDFMKDMKDLCTLATRAWASLEIRKVDMEELVDLCKRLSQRSTSGCAGIATFQEALKATQSYQELVESYFNKKAQEEKDWSATAEVLKVGLRNICVGLLIAAACGLVLAAGGAVLGAVVGAAAGAAGTSGTVAVAGGIIGAKVGMVVASPYMLGALLEAGSDIKRDFDAIMADRIVHTNTLEVIQSIQKKLEDVRADLEAATEGMKMCDVTLSEKCMKDVGSMLELMKKRVQQEEQLTQLKMEVQLKAKQLDDKDKELEKNRQEIERLNEQLKRTPLQQ